MAGSLYALKHTLSFYVHMTPYPQIRPTKPHLFFDFEYYFEYYARLKWGSSYGHRIQKLVKSSRTGVYYWSTQQQHISMNKRYKLFKCLVAPHISIHGWKNKFVKRMDSLIEEKGITPHQLAKDLDMSVNTIYRYRSKVFIPSRPTIIKMAGYFGVSPDYLLGIDVKFKNY